MQFWRLEVPDPGAGPLPPGPKRLSCCCALTWRKWGRSSLASLFLRERSAFMRVLPLMNEFPLQALPLIQSHWGLGCNTWMWHDTNTQETAVNTQYLNTPDGSLRWGRGALPFLDFLGSWGILVGRESQCCRVFPLCFLTSWRPLT